MSNQGPIGFGDPNDEELPTFAGMPGDPLPTDVEESTDDAVTFIEPESAHAPSVAQPDAEAILEVRDLRMYFPVKSAGIIRRTIGHVQAVDGVSFQLPAGGSLGLVGESGCGKSTTGRLITRLYEPTGGTIVFDGKDITKTSARGLKPLRREIQMIFQDPYTSLNPRKRVGQIIGEPLRIHGLAEGREIERRVREKLDQVGLSGSYYDRYPHEFSGGQRQRIGIARALAPEPSLIVADEPVSALDVSIQGQIVNLMADLQRELELTYLFVAHDLGVVRQVSDRIAVMYLGKIVEIGPAELVYSKPIHPYTASLLAAVPIPDPRTNAQRERRPLEGDVPSPSDPPSGCRFHTRCPYATEVCEQQEPALIDYGQGHFAACHHPLGRPDPAGE